MAKAITTSHGGGSFKRVLQKIRQDRVAFAAFIVLIGLYLTIIFAGFLAPYDEMWYDRQAATAPPTTVYVLDENGSLTWPYVFEYEKRRNPQTYEVKYVPKLGRKYPVKLFARGDEYRLLGFIPGDIHLFGVDEPARINLLGTDINGRDVFSRMLFGGQISMTIGFLALFVAIPIGLVYGGLSGYLGGRTDNLMMRLAEVIMAIPAFYLLISLSVLLPAGLSSSMRFALVVVILAFIGWAGFSRVIRGMVLKIREEEFVEAARASGIKTLPLIIKHILPQTASYVLVALTLGVPGYILAESGLSFLGLGIQQPDASWGNMLKEAQEVTNIFQRPQMLMPGFMIFLAVLSFNIIGDAVRDILDPKSYIRK